ncbi:MAG: putative DNA binding domain-containing protein [Anaerolineae bacterium]|nr:putative DNA binding domain-containing protein [Anaerolineae bacterium]
MNEPDLNLIIRDGRHTRVDWFSEQTPLGIIATTMTAMANSQGGLILMGVAGPTGAAIGVRDADGTVDRVLQAALSLDPPLIIPVPHVTHFNSQSVVIIQIPQGMPHVYSLDGRYLARAGTENVPLAPRDLRRLIFERGEINFETEVPPGATLDDIHWEKAEAYATSLSGLGETNVHKVLVKRGCLTTVDGDLRPTNAGILLFGRDPQRFVRSAEITAARFAGETMSDTFSRQDILGTLPDQIKRAETFMIDHLRKGVHLGTTMARQENFEYPLEAARELVVNAVAHRDYSINGDGIRLFIFKNHMEITNPGRLAGPVTVDNIKDERFSRNPVIVQVLSDMGFIERLGYGVDRVIHLMQQQNLRVPEFEETSGGFRVILRNQPVDEIAVDEAAPPKIAFDGVYNGLDINPRQEAALVYLHTPGNSRITNSDLQQLCPDVHAETIRRDLVDLVTKHILQKMGQKRGSYYILKRD